MVSKMKSKAVYLLGLPALVVLLGRAGDARSATALYQTREGEMAGYLIVPIERVPGTYNAGFSQYAAAWPLQKYYPGNRFQSGLFGTWMFAQYDANGPPKKFYSDIEGGLGWWRDTRFATETPKFIMGGVAPDFVEWANGPGAGKGRDWDKPMGKYGVAQLTPWLLWPPDGLNLKQGTCGELFGYGYLPLPLTEPKTTTAGKNVPTGNNCWTLFLNTSNFKGPVAFFTPFFWSRHAIDEPLFRGMLLDSRPSEPNRSLQMETQYIPCVLAVRPDGDTYARVAPTLFPCGTDRESVVIHRITSYNKDALWGAVKQWFEGGSPASGAINAESGYLHEFRKGGRATWRIYADDTPKEKRANVAWSSFATPVVPDSNTYGFQWNSEMVGVTNYFNGSVVVLPEYYHLRTNANQKLEWVPVRAEDVPAQTGLAKVRFERLRERSTEPYVTPEEPTCCWKNPGPKAGPFQAKLGDGSVVTYYWYRFADQPALLNADLTDQEREQIQSRVEKLHRYWTPDREYLPPPKTGKLAAVDPALIVKPPPGLEVGYVPIVTKQAAKP